MTDSAMQPTSPEPSPESTGDDVAINRATDKANGDKFAELFHGRAIWVPGLDWLLYDTTRWVQDDGLARYRLIAVLVQALRVLAVEEGDQEQTEIYERRIRRLEHVSGANGALTFAAARLEVPLSRLDANPLLINFPNGTYDPRRDKDGRRIGLRVHNPSDYITRLCPTEYHPATRDAIWERVLADLFNHDSSYNEGLLDHLRRSAGYTLLGLTNEKKIFVPNGPRDTAKSTVVEAVYRALGDVADGGYATTWDAEVVEAGTRVNRNEKLDKARAARMVVVGELDKGSRMADGFVKRYSGGDTMDACAKYKSSYSYRPQGKIWMPTNYVPKSADKAVQGRLDLLPFQNVPKKLDRSIKLHLETNENAHRAVLAWAMGGLVDYLDAREAGNEQPLGETPWLDALVTRYSHESDSLLDFLESCFETTDAVPLQPSEDDGSPHTDTVYWTYEIWAQDNVKKDQVLKKRVFGYALEERGFVRARVPSHGGTMRWRGLKWKPREEWPLAIQAAAVALEQQQKAASRAQAAGL